MNLARKQFMVPVLGALLLAGMCVESIALGSSRTTLPLSTLVAVGALPVLLVLHPKLRSGPITRSVVMFVMYAVVHSIVALMIDVATGADAMIRLIAWVRQIAAVFGGLAVYLVYRQVLPLLDDRQVTSYLWMGLVPASVLATLAILWGLFDWAWAGRLLGWIVETLPINGYVARGRAAGLSLEPAHFAVYLVTIGFPAVVYAFGAAHSSRWRAPIALLFTGIAFAWTFSLTGVAALLGALAAVLISPSYRKYGAALACIVLLVLAGTLVYPNNYMKRQARALVGAVRVENMAWNASITDTFYSLVGPLMATDTSWVIVGYGLGGTSTHFDELIPEYARETLARAKRENLPNLGSMVGRVYAETGLLGLILFIRVWWVTFRVLRKWESRQHLRKVSHLAVAGARMGLGGTAVAFTLKIGSFALPYFWFWLALVESRSRERRQGERVRTECAF